jgi:cathepsin B
VCICTLFANVQFLLLFQVEAPAVQGWQEAMLLGDGTAAPTFGVQAGGGMIVVAKHTSASLKTDDTALLSSKLAPAAVLRRRAANWSLIDAVNADSSGARWHAGPPSGAFEAATLGDFASLCRTLPETSDVPLQPPPLPTEEAALVAALPANFDWRHQPIASKCPSISTVRDQAGCGSCWSFGTAEAMSDRLCIASKGAVTVELSSQHIASCACAPPPPCKKSPCTCPQTPAPACPCGSGCNGGQLGQAWDFYLNTGVVDGGLFGDNSTCDPYTIPTCAHHTADPKKKNCSENVATTPDPTDCGRKQCVNGKDFNASKHFALSKAVAVHGEAAMMQEIMAHGPLSCSFIVMDFFVLYKGGIMDQSIGSPRGQCWGHMLGFHAVEITGWGLDSSNASDPIKYWIVKNRCRRLPLWPACLDLVHCPQSTVLLPSVLGKHADPTVHACSWNADWGEKGYFRWLRGPDFCNMQSGCVAGMPKPSW